jgi:hypothetical protein
MTTKAEHAKQVVFEYFTTKHDDEDDSLRDKIAALLQAVNDFVGAPVTSGFSATISAAAPAKRPAG